MQKHIQNQDQMLTASMSGNKLTPEQLQAMAGDDEDAEIKALLTPEQLAAYPDYQQAETMANADSKAKREVTMMTMSGGIDLSQEQQDKVHAALYQLNLNFNAGFLFGFASGFMVISSHKLRLPACPPCCLVILINTPKRLVVCNPVSNAPATGLYPTLRADSLRRAWVSWPWFWSPLSNWQSSTRGRGWPAWLRAQGDCRRILADRRRQCWCLAKG